MVTFRISLIHNISHMHLSLTWLNRCPSGRLISPDNQHLTTTWQSSKTVLKNLLVGSKASRSITSSKKRSQQCTCIKLHCLYRLPLKNRNFQMQPNINSIFLQSIEETRVFQHQFYLNYGKTGFLLTKSIHIDMISIFYLVRRANSCLADTVKNQQKLQHEFLQKRSFPCQFLQLLWFVFSLNGSPELFPSGIQLEFMFAATWLQ